MSLVMRRIGGLASMLLCMLLTGCSSMQQARSEKSDALSFDETRQLARDASIYGFPHVLAPEVVDGTWKKPPPQPVE